MIASPSLFARPVSACIALLVACVAAPAAGAEATAPSSAPLVITRRLPDGGLQPQAVVDEHGVAHVIYLKPLDGEPLRCDVLYTRSADGGKTFSDPVRVNSHPGSAIATGTVRGAHLAIGKAGRLHVAWNGSPTAEPKAPGKQAPMLYTRTDDDGNFEPQRNLITTKPGLDGGGSVAADDRGNVYVVWHAPYEKAGGEDKRLVYAATSSDEGKTFSPEDKVSSFAGVCACCGLCALAGEGGRLYVLYRQAVNDTDRAMRLAVRRVPENGAAGPTVETGSHVVGPMNIGTCPMSTAALARVPGPEGNFAAAWEEAGRLRWQHFEPMTAVERPGTLHTVPPGSEFTEPAKVKDDGRNRKHPALAFDKAGRMILAWTEGTGWQKGGSVAWQVYDPKGKPIQGKGAAGRADDLPAWDLPAAFPRPDGGFVVVY